MITLDTSILDLTSPSGIRQAGEYALVAPLNGSQGLGMAVDHRGNACPILACVLFDEDVMGGEDLIRISVSDRGEYPLIGTPMQRVLVDEGSPGHANGIWKSLLELTPEDKLVVPAMHQSGMVLATTRVRRKGKVSRGGCIVIPGRGRHLCTMQIKGAKSFATPSGICHV